MKQAALLLFLSLSSSHVDKVLGENCGAGIGTCAYAGPEFCCSGSNWCGTTPDYCGAGCQPDYGTCDGSPPPPTGNNNWCGDAGNWLTAKSCGQSCYDGTDDECLASGQVCFASITSCPVVTGPSPPSPTPPTTPIPTPPPPTPPTGPTVAGGDSRVIAYVGNWQTCPTAAQLDGYTHLIIAFAVTYTWQCEGCQNQCDTNCNVANTAPVALCVGQTGNQVAEWQALGKKVILSFGGAGMGGSWFDDINNCWDYCFEKEDALSTQLVTIVDNQGFDGVDIDYEYCYDTASGRHAGCNQVTNAYSDLKAQTFLSDMTSKLRQKMDTLGGNTNKEYELTHAPMDSDLVTDSPYYQILKTQNANLNFLMPQFYNGVTRPVLDGFDGTNGNSGQTDTYIVYSNIANDMFPGQPEKVVFGFCISGCQNNADGAQAATVMSQVKAYNNGEFACNGGAFFWVAAADFSGGWSDPVYAEVSQTAGCSDPGTSTPTKSPSKSPSANPTTSPSATQFPGTCSDGSGSCSATDMSQCTCSTRRKLLKGGVSKNKEVKNNLRRLQKIKTTPPPTSPPPPTTPNPTAPPTKLPTANPTNAPTAHPTDAPTGFQCTCNLPTPEPTAPPTNVVTPEPTSFPTNPPTQPSGNCNCSDYTQKNLCNDNVECGGNACSWTNSQQTCGPAR